MFKYAFKSSSQLNVVNKVDMSSLRVPRHTGRYKNKHRTTLQKKIHDQTSVESR